MEPGLVLIPLLITFLSVLQISTGVLGRVESASFFQGRVAQVAIGSVRPEMSIEKIALPGGGSLTIGRGERAGPSITPLLPGGDAYTVTGIAITESDIGG